LAKDGDEQATATTPQRAGSASSGVDLNRLKIRDRAAPPRRGRWKILVLCLLFLGIGVGGSYLWNHYGVDRTLKVDTALVQAAHTTQAQQFTAGGWIEVARPAWPLVVTCRISERLETLSVREGQVLEAGQVIATLYSKDIQTRLDLAQADADAAARNLDRFNAGFRKEEIDAAAARVAETAEQQRIAANNYKRSQAVPPGGISQEDLDRDLSALNRAKALHAQAMADLAKLKAGYRKEDVAVARAELTRAQRNVELIERELSYCTIQAPEFDRPLRVLKVLHRVGEWIDAKKQPELIWLYDPTQMQARADVTQPNIRSVAVGKPAIVITEANPQRKYKGTVLRIEPLAELAKNTVTVRIKIDDPDELLFPEMTARITFLADKPILVETAGAVFVPTAAVLDEGGRKYVFVLDAGRAGRRDVTVGAVAGSQMRITGGLQPGQRIITSHLGSLRPGLAVEEK